MIENYLQSVKKQFAYYRSLGDKTFAQLSEPELFWEYSADNNSVAIIVNHLSGNMLSRWTDFLTTDGEKEWRQRDEEFEDQIKTREELLDKWNKGWDRLFQALGSVNTDNFNEVVYIRNMGHTVVEAINRQLAHYAYHVGQITYLGKMIRGEQWQSLSVPKGGSKTYNATKFAQPKRRAHFTDEFLRDRE
ncbi:MAG: DUF1572 family protein [Bacteroidota bacterium]